MFRIIFMQQYVILLCHLFKGTIKVSSINPKYVHMKKIILPVFLVFSYLQVHAENQLKPKYNFSDTFMIKNLQRDSVSIKSYILGLNKGNIFLYKNEKGNVFSLAPDNMYCLAPLELPKMPVQKDKALNYMPNKILPEQKNL